MKNSLTINRGNNNNIKQDSKSKDSQKGKIPFSQKESEERESESEEIQKIDFPYNQRTKESYERHGFEVPDSVDYQERSFLGSVNIEEGGPIRRVITRMVRVKSRDYESGDKMKFKEYLYCFEDWFGNDWLGDPVAPCTDHVEGMYYEQESRTIRERDMKTGRMLPPKYKRIGEHAVYYIPWEGKDQVDRLLGDRDPASVVFTIKFPAGVSGGSGIRNNFSYDHFVNLKMEGVSSSIPELAGQA